MEMDARYEEKSTSIAAPSTCEWAGFCRSSQGKREDILEQTPTRDFKFSERAAGKSGYNRVAKTHKLYSDVVTVHNSPSHKQQ